MQKIKLKRLEENIGQKRYHIGFGNDFLDLTPKLQATTKIQQNGLYGN